jgi:signal recognition particle receptor subunit beta
VSVINPLAREIASKVVFYGPGLSGKTTTLSFVHSHLQPSRRGDLITLETEGERTLFFDFLPVKVETKSGLSMRFQLYTVPGQVFYAATRQLVLEGADGVVFVADSQEDAQERNLESLEDLEQNLRRSGRSLSTTPFVMQYNKRDLPTSLPVDVLRARLNPHGAPDFETVAHRGVGVEAVLLTIMKAVRRNVELEGQRARRRTDQGRKPTLELVDLTKEGSSPMSVVERIREASESEVNNSKPAPPPEPDEMYVDLRQTGPRTIPAPAMSNAALSFAHLWENPVVPLQIEKAIVEGSYAEAVYRAASAVSEILDRVLGPYSDEGYGARVLLMGLDGREYLELRRIAGRAASAVTHKDALFALHFLVSVRLREQRLTRY